MKFLTPQAALYEPLLREVYHEEYSEISNEDYRTIRAVQMDIWKHIRTTFDQCKPLTPHEILLNSDVMEYVKESISSGAFDTILAKHGVTRDHALAATKQNELSEDDEVFLRSVDPHYANNLHAVSLQKYAALSTNTEQTELRSIIQNLGHIFSNRDLKEESAKLANALLYEVKSAARKVKINSSLYGKLQIILKLIKQESKGSEREKILLRELEQIVHAIVSNLPIDMNAVQSLDSLYEEVKIHESAAEIVTNALLITWEAVMKRIELHTPNNAKRLAMFRKTRSQSGIISLNELYNSEFKKVDDPLYKAGSEQLSEAEKIDSSYDRNCRLDKLLEKYNGSSVYDKIHSVRYPAR